MKTLMFFMLSILALLLAPGHVLADQRRDLSLKELFERTLSANVDIKIIELEKRVRAANLPTLRSVYDTFLSGSAGYSTDSTLKSSPFYADEVKTFTIGAQLARQFSDGTKLDLSGTFTRLDNPSSFTSFNPYYESALELAVSQPLLKNRWGLNERSAIEAEEMEISAYSMEADRRTEAVLFSVLRDYAALYLAREVALIRTQGLEKARELLDANRDKKELGLVEDVGIFALEANVLNREVELDIADKERDTAVYALCRQLDIRPETAPGITPLALPFAERVLPDLPSSFERARAKRTDYQALLRRAQKSDIMLVSRENELLPALDLKASLKINGLDSSAGDALSGLGDFNEEIFVGLQLSTSLERRAAKGKLEQAQMEKEKILLQLYLKELEIIVELATKTREAQTAADNIAKRAEIARLHKRKLEEEEKRFDQGRSDIRNLIDYQTDLLSAREMLTAARVHYSITAADLLLSEGLLYEKMKEEKDRA